MEVIFDVKHVSDRMMLIKLAVRKSIVTVLFYENLQWTLTKISASEILLVCGDFNGHTGKNADG